MTVENWLSRRMCNFHKTIRLLLILYSLIVEIKGNSFDVTTCEWLYTSPPGSSTTFALACPGSGVKIAYINYPPYIYSEEGSTVPKGIWVDLLEDFVDRACPGSTTTISWNKMEFKTSKELQDYCKLSYSCAMSVPAVASSGDTSLNSVDWAEFDYSQGVALVTITGEEWRRVIPLFLKSIMNAWPLLVLCLFGSFLAGVCIWLLDTWSNVQQFPRPFFTGIFEGFWWGIVTMSTVGYGDKAPVSFHARLFSIIWIVFGISVLSSLTSILSKSFIEIATPPLVTFTGNEVGCLDTVPITVETISIEGGTATIASNYLELENWMARGLIKAFAMDTRQLAYYWNHRLSKITNKNKVKFRLQKIYPYTKKYGLSAHPVSVASEIYRTSGIEGKQPWFDCMKKYMEKNAHDLSRMQKYYADKVLNETDTTILKPADFVPFSMIEPSTDIFIAFTWVIGSIVVGILLFGITFECCRLLIFHSKDQESSLGLSSGNPLNGNNVEFLTRQEANVHEAVYKALHNVDKIMRESDRDLENIIRETSRSIRREMTAVIKKGNGHINYGL